MDDKAEFLGRLRIDRSEPEARRSWPLAVGMAGGLFPAVRAARMPVTDALHAA